MYSGTCLKYATLGFYIGDRVRSPISEILCTDLYLNAKAFLKERGSRKESKAWDHREARIGFQRSSPQNNFRRLIAAPISAGNFCFDTVSYVSESSSRMNLALLAALLNSKVLDWYFRLGSTNSKVNEYQFNNLPVPSITDTGAEIRWQPQFQRGEWKGLSAMLCSWCDSPGVMLAEVAEALAAMSRRIYEIEAGRVLKNRSERSRLAPECQPIQDAIYAVLFRCYGLSDDDAQYVERRLKEML